MKTQFQSLPPQRSLSDIEYEVRRMRAEVLRAAAAALGRSLVRLFTRGRMLSVPAKA